MSVLLKLGGNLVLDRPLDLTDVFSGSNSGSVSHSKDVGVHSLGWMGEPHVQHDVGGFPSHAWQGLKRGPR